MKKHLLIALVSVATISCEDDIVPTLAPPPPPANYAPLEVGNWWAYQLIRYEYSQNDTIYGSVDTISVLADTLINGETFKKLSGNRFSFYSPIFVRDSSGYVVNHLGNLDYTYVNFIDTFHTPSPNGGYSQYLIVDPEPTVVPAGTYNTINFLRKEYNFPVPSSCGIDTAYWDIRLSEDVGIVEYAFFYSATASGPCSRTTRQLVDYYVQ